MKTTTITSEQSKQIARELINQLGGNKFFAMTGCMHKYCDNYSSTFKMTRNKVGAQFMTITLNAMDTYDMQFVKVNTKTGEVKPVAERAGIYGDMLQSIFTDVTGLYTSLGTMGR